MRVEHFLVRGGDGDAEVATAAKRIEHFRVTTVEIRTQRALGDGVIAIRPRGKPAAAHAVAETAFFLHRERRTRPEVELTTERIGPLVGRLAGDDFNGFIHRTRKRVQGRRAAIATDAGRGHAVDVEAGVTSGETADTHVVDKIILIGRERDAGHTRNEFTDVLSREHAPLVESGDVFDVGGITLLRERQCLPFPLRLDGKRRHGDDFRRAQDRV